MKNKLSVLLTNTMLLVVNIRLIRYIRQQDYIHPSERGRNERSESQLGYNNILINSKPNGTVGNRLTCDYLYVGLSDMETMPDISAIPDWSDDTLLLADFNNEDLIAGNSAIKGNINGYQLRRKKSGETHTTYITTIGENTGNKIIDYMTANNSAYT